MKKVSIIIPVFNEKNTIKALLEKVQNANFSSLEKEIIMVDDCSNDGTTEILRELSKNYKVFFHEKNQGKGAAIRTAIKEATGDFVVIQDADLEYLPDDYDKLLPLLINDEADVVYGSRFKNQENSKEKTELMSCYINSLKLAIENGIRTIEGILRETGKLIIVLNDEDILSTEEETKLVEEIVYKQIIANPTMSSRQIPSKFRIRESLPLSKNSKVSFNELINEGLKGNEISVDVMETNLSVGNIEIYPPN